MRLRRYRHLLLLTALLAAPLHAAEPYLLTASEWDRPRSGDRVLAMPSIRAAVEALAANPGSLLEIRHGGDEESQLWAEELRGWLVALAIPSKQIRLATSPLAADRIELYIQAN